MKVSERVLGMNVLEPWYVLSSGGRNCKGHWTFGQKINWAKLKYRKRKPTEKKQNGKVEKIVWSFRLVICCRISTVETFHTAVMSHHSMPQKATTYCRRILVELKI